MYYFAAKYEKGLIGTSRLTGNDDPELVLEDLRYRMTNGAITAAFGVATGSVFPLLPIDLISDPLVQYISEPLSSLAHIPNLYAFVYGSPLPANKLQEITNMFLLRITQGVVQQSAMKIIAKVDKNNLIIPTSDHNEKIQAMEENTLYSQRVLEMELMSKAGLLFISYKI